MIATAPEGTLDETMKFQIPILSLGLAEGVSAWYQLNVFSDRPEYWQKPLSLRQFGKPAPPMTSTEECRQIARNKAKSQLDAVTIWNQEDQNVQARAVAFYPHSECKRRPRDAKPRAGVGPLPILIIALDPNRLDGLHIAALSRLGIVVNPVAFQAFDIDTATSSKGILAKYAGKELTGSIFVWNNILKSYETSDRYRIQHIQPGRWAQLGGDTAIYAWMKLETEKALLGRPVDEPTQKKIEEFELIQLGPYLGYRDRPELERLDEAVLGFGGGHAQQHGIIVVDDMSPNSNTGRIPEAAMPLFDELEQDADLFDFASPLILDLHHVDDQAPDPDLYLSEARSVNEEPQTLFDLPDTILQETLDDQTLRNAPVSERQVVLEAFERGFRSKFDETEAATENILLQRLLPSYRSSFDTGKWFAEIVSATGSIMNRIIQFATTIYNTNGNPDIESGNSGIRDSIINFGQHQPHSQTMH
ncbi:hypothetical protein TWF506_009413 [Arthrobotrys conoides]|uniref:Uncharacterized protein n=1 Tax=Arthrobotrys conoides TaxID=74498 RepID=A0AAN8RMA9_9PEZI